MAIFIGVTGGEIPHPRRRESPGNYGRWRCLWTMHFIILKRRNQGQAVLCKKRQKGYCGMRNEASLLYKGEKIPWSNTPGKSGACIHEPLKFRFALLNLCAYLPVSWNIVLVPIGPIPEQPACCVVQHPVLYKFENVYYSRKSQTF
ncbi:hypothetical protein Holit_02762 [Hollandina sp. SP2]